jgi:hypothetical protein
MMHVLINVKFPNNISKWQMGFNSAFKGLMYFSHQELSPADIAVSLSLSNFLLVVFLFAK